MPIFNIQGKPIKLAGVIPLYRDKDVSNLIDAILATGTTLNLTQRMYIVANIEGMKGIGTWDINKAVYGVVGSNSESHKFNWKNPVNTDASFRLTFGSGVLHNNNGIKSNGAITGLIQTQLNPAINFSTNSISMSYCSSVVEINSFLEEDMGFSDQFRLGIMRGDAGVGFFIATNSAHPTIDGAFVDGSSKGYIIGSITPSKLFILLNNSLTDLNGDFYGGSTFPNALISMGGLNNTGSYTRKTTGFATIGEGMSETTARNQSQIVNFAQKMRANF